MSDHLTIDVDTSSLLAALDRLGVVAEKHIREAALETAGRVASEARARVARATGVTAGAITIDEEKTRPGFRVFVAPTQRAANLPIWLEFGTKRMTARPFLFSSARLEEGAHERRVAAALQDAIDEVGG